MSDALQAFIRQRLTELDTREAELRSALIGIDAERTSLHRAAEAASEPVQEGDGSTLKDALNPVRRARRRRYEKTVKGSVLKALHAAGRPLTPQELRSEVTARLGRDVTQKGLSPELSHLKAEGLIVSLDGGAYALPQHSTTKQQS